MGQRREKKRWGFESAKVGREFSKNIRYWDGIAAPSSGCFESHHCA